MLIYAGIDEAGYGPMLGPLCVACAAFAVDGHDVESGSPDLWKRLSTVVCRAGRDRLRGARTGRIAIDDSKKLKGARTAKAHPLRRLERGVLTFLAAGDPAPAPGTDDRLYERLGIPVPPCSWYESTVTLPVAQTRDQAAIDAARLGRALSKAGVVMPLLRCEAIDGAGFNQQVGRLGNKAAVNFGAVMRLVDAVWSRWPDEHPRVVVDRQGGRVHYREPLQLAYPDAHIRIVAEDERLSRYRLEADGRRLTISFSTAAEDRHLPVALASMTAKYVRELFMLRLNRFFQGHVAELKPTAGYVQDARRYLRDIAPALRELRIERSDFVRAV